MHMLTLDGETIVYREQQLPLLLRLFTLVLGLALATMIPIPFIIHADWTTPSLVLLVAALCIVAPILLGSFFVLISLVSATELRLDPTTGWADRTLRGPIINKKDRFRLSEMSPPEAFMRDTDDDPIAILRLRLPGRRWKIDMPGFSSLADAQRWRDLITQAISQ